MSMQLGDPLFLAGLVAGFAGLLMMLQGRLQVRLLQRRIALGAGSAVFDAPTGLFAPSAAWHCIRAEANRAYRLGRPLDVWVGTAGSAAELDEVGRGVALGVGAGTTAIRLDDRRLCLVSCAGLQQPADLLVDIEWQRRRLPADADTAQNALAYVSDGTHG